MTLEEKYPFVASWVRSGHIQIGQVEACDYEPFAGVYEVGGPIWETDEPFNSLDEVLAKINRAISAWCQEQGIKLVDSRGRVIPFPKD